MVNEVYTLDENNVITNRIVADEHFLSTLDCYALCDDYPPADIGDPLPEPLPKPEPEPSQESINDFILGMMEGIKDAEMGLR